jgi:molybdenum-dependent DNA-binding transcriptional regulator ModE
MIGQLSMAAERLPHPRSIAWLLGQAPQPCAFKLHFAQFAGCRDIMAKPTTEQQRLGIIVAYMQHKSIRRAARALGMSHSVVLRWVTIWKQTGSVETKRRGFKPAAMNARAARAATRMLLSGGFSGAGDVARALCQKGITQKQVHRTTVTRAAKKQAVLDGAPIQAVRGKPAKRLTADTRQKRLCFAAANQATKWQEVMFTDRKKFLFSYPGAKVTRVEWLKKGQKREALAVNHPQVLNLYMGITVHGVTAVHVVTGSSQHKSTYVNKQGQGARNITSGEYTDVLKQTLLPQGQQLMAAKGVTSWVLQQDNDPSHKGAASIIKQHSKGNSCSVTLMKAWPPNSPDLNPIENVWAWAQDKVNSKVHKTFKEFRDDVVQTLSSVPQAMLISLYKSMPTRLARVIALDGGKTGY